MPQLTPEHPFAQYIRILGRGKKGSRSLSFEEAKIAMQLIIENKVEAEQIGAFLMLLRVKEESPEEIAGFVSSVRAQLPQETQQIAVDLDWSSYAGKRKQYPWFLLAVFALSNTGVRILMHGSSGHTNNRVYTQQILQALGLNSANSWVEVAQQLDTIQFSFLPLHNFNPALQKLISLKPILGLRSPINTLVRLINPCLATHSISSIFHPAYAHIQAQAGQLLGQKHFMVFKGEGGEIECRPEADLKMLRIIDGEIQEHHWPRLQQQKAEIPSDFSLQENRQQLRNVWHGEETNTYALASIMQTLAISVSLLNPQLEPQNCMQRAQIIWQQRRLNFI